MPEGEFNPKSPGVAAPRVLLTDTNRWPSSARLAIGLSKAGCHVYGVCPRRGHPLLYTRIVEQTFPYSGIRPLQSLEAAIDATQPQIIVPCDDRGVQHLHELHARSRSLGTSGAGVADLIEFSLGSPEGYLIASNRCDLLRIASEEGVRVPDTKLLKTADDLDSWQVGHDLPWVLKGDGTFGGRGVRIAHTAGEAKQCFSDITTLFKATRAIKRTIVNRDAFWLRPWWNNYRPAVIVQSHIKGRPANCAFVSWKGKVLSCIGVEVISSEGSTGPAVVVRVVDNREMTTAAERIAHRLGLSGFYGLDFMIEEGSGQAYLIEMNPRCTPLSHLQLGAGRDLIGAVWAQLAGQPPPATPPVTLNDMIAYFPQAWTTKSEFLQSAYLDIPREEPDLVQDLLRPWPDRSLLYRLVSKVSSLATAAADRKSAKHSVPLV
jgi:ATP-grasp domain